MRDVKQEHSSVISLNSLFPVLSTPASSLHTQNFHPLPKLLGQKPSHCVKGLFHVAQASPYFIFYKRAVYFCGTATVHRATSDGWLPGCGRCHGRSWAELLVPGEKCSKMSFWLGTAGSPAPQAAAGDGPCRHLWLLLLRLGSVWAPMFKFCSLENLFQKWIGSLKTWVAGMIMNAVFSKKQSVSKKIKCSCLESLW